MPHFTTRLQLDKTLVLANARHFKKCEQIPLLVHASGKCGRWARKINGRLHYFGQVQPQKPDFGANAALALYHQQRPDLEAGRSPLNNCQNLTVADLCNLFLCAKDHALQRGDIVQRTRIDYQRTAKRVAQFFGRSRPVSELTIQDFNQLHHSLAQGRGAHALANEIRRTRTLFKYAFDAGLVQTPVRLGPDFRPPAKRVMRQIRYEAPLQMFQPEEIHAILNLANPQLHAMILLGANCGFGNADVGLLPLNALDLQTAWVHFPRPKTAVQRRCPLWPETVLALQTWLQQRKPPKNRLLKNRAFLTKSGQSWHKETFASPLSAEFAKLLKSVDLAEKQNAQKCRRKPRPPVYRKGRGFYALRHGFQTIGDEAKDPVALQFLMGHAEASNDMAAVYRESVADPRLLAITRHVHAWLFDKKEGQ